MRTCSASWSSLAIGLTLGLLLATAARTSAQSPADPTPRPPSQTPTPSPDAISTPAGSGDSGSRSGWQELIIQKTPEEQKLHDQLYGPDSAIPGRGTPAPRTAAVLLPPQHDAIRTTIGFGYVQGADSAIEISALGSSAGVRTDLNALLTMGPLGLTLYSGHVMLSGDDNRWSAEGGDLFSELRGPGRGVRFSWLASDTFRQRVSLFVPRYSVEQSPPVLAYANELQLFSGMLVGAELSSDRGYLVKGQLAKARLSLDASYRSVDSAQHHADKGFYAAYAVWRGVAIQGGVRVSTGVDSLQWRTIGVRFPVSNQVSVTLERSATATDRSEQNASLMAVNLPLGPIRLMQRYQWGEYSYFRQRGTFAGDQRQLQSAASYSPTRQLSFAVQMANQWQPDGRVRQWQELHTTFRASRGTELQAFTAFPNLSEPDQLRMQIAQALPKRFSVVAEYGRLSAFQSVATFDGERPRFKLVLRKAYDVSTPAAGGQIAGNVLDTQGFPVPGIGVRLGPYRTVSDREGRYVFTRLPRGDYELSLDDETIPASFAPGTAKRQLIVTKTTHDRLDLIVVPLNAIHGHVYCDLNQNERLDPGEEVPSVALRLGDRATATDQNGAYTFGNVAPGEYRVSLIAERLSAQYEATAPAEIVVTLAPDRPAIGVDFRVVKKQKKIVLQELAR
jgi:hypothetical protein